ncbi:MAG: peptidylprolyl isomerase [Deltaproteobacteria bacterium]|nr:peptidylprolyl isomerase [Deltaproteobacteria bacterium]MBW1922967.1 peptidylprolyl isomerase [Deltaproteobacteria bacterium]MBW1949055.1 peptidylprolyl isomerase [Deltaproteobacteria bacterium]MBW2007395.1 peptidylprolyl isomerase [Deltaproteobacteria bacterium]MBW2101779.1 peptidylprolyl isomerase [Deltaproteobacteria bacterium]
MTQAREGHTVKVHYTGKLENGEVFDSSKERQPLEFKIGEGSLIPGFENGVLGMEEGQTRTIRIESEDAYGPRREELVVEVEKSRLPQDIIPAVGQQLQMQQPGAQPITVVITEVGEETVTLDANHPLAGATLFFDVEMLQIS